MRLPNVRGVKVVISLCCCSEGLMSCWTLNGSHTWRQSISPLPNQPRKDFLREDEVAVLPRAFPNHCYQLYYMDHQSVISHHRSISRNNVKIGGNCTQMVKSDLAGLFWFVCFIPQRCLGRKLTRGERKNTVKWMFLLAAVTLSLPRNHPGRFLPLLDAVTAKRFYFRPLFIFVLIC